MYFMDPIYKTNHILGTQDYAKNDINYTTDYFTNNPVTLDLPYEYKVSVEI